MRVITVIVFSFFMLCGCAKICEFGKGGQASGLQCIGLFSHAKVGMSQKEITDQIGLPEKKNSDIEYHGKKYDEAWVYDTKPATILYFKNGILEHKDYQQ